jgi:hypothetical protein
MVGDGLLATKILTASEVELHPFELVTVRIKLPASETSMLLVVSLVDHVFPETSDELKVTVDPSQIVVLPCTLMIGIDGLAITSTSTGREVVEQP